MSLKAKSKANKALLRELPFSTLWPAQFNALFKNNSFNNYPLPTKNDLERLTSIHDLDLFNLNMHDGRFNNNSNDNCYLQIKPCKYYSPNSFSQLKNTLNVPIADRQNKFSVLHNNIRSLKKNLERLQSHLLDELAYHFDIISVTETRIKQDALDFNPSIPNYNF